jgi:carbon monoxide dehydrogenase subunit G
MAAVTVERRVDAPIPRVWDVATDIEGSPAVLSGVDTVTVLDTGSGRDGRLGVGTRWQETRTLRGRAATEEMWVTEVQPLRSYTVEAESHGHHYVSTFRFDDAGRTERGPATLVTLGFDARPLGRVGRWLAPLTLRLVRRTVASALAKDLEDLARAAETPRG